MSHLAHMQTFFMSPTAKCHHCYLIFPLQSPTLLEVLEVLKYYFSGHVSFVSATIHQKAMDTGVSKPHITSKPNYYEEKLLKTSSVLSFLAILLTFALFARIEIVARNTETMDSKFTQQIQRMREALDKAAILQERKKGDSNMVFGRSQVFCV